MKNSIKRVLFGAGCYYLIFISHTLAGHTISWWQYLLMFIGGCGLSVGNILFPRK